MSVFRLFLRALSLYNFCAFRKYLFTMFKLPKRLLALIIKILRDSAERALLGGDKT